MELPDSLEKSVHRVATWSSTRNREKRRRGRLVKEKGQSREEDRSGSSDPEGLQPPENFCPSVELGKGVKGVPLDLDIGSEVRKHLQESGRVPKPERGSVTFNDFPGCHQPGTKGG